MELRGMVLKNRRTERGYFELARILAATKPSRNQILFPGPILKNRRVHLHQNRDRRGRMSMRMNLTQKPKFCFRFFDATTYHLALWSLCASIENISGDYCLLACEGDNLCYGGRHCWL